MKASTYNQFFNFLIEEENLNHINSDKVVDQISDRFNVLEVRENFQNNVDCYSLLMYTQKYDYSITIYKYNQYKKFSLEQLKKLYYVKKQILEDLIGINK
jgi:hypothetical protein